MKKIVIIILSLLANISYSNGQCKEYYSSFKCRPSSQEGKDMFLSSQSRSIYLEANVAYKFQMTFFRKMDYKLIFCAEKSKFYPIHFVIYEKETGKLLFDNKEDKYVESIGLTIDNTIIVIIEMTLMADGTEFDDIRDNRTCVGIPIMYRKVPKMGN